MIALMRISLWADGEAHESCSVDEMLFLTVAWDWFLFGHQRPERVSKRERIFEFCFDFLQYIEDADFSLVSILAADDARHNKLVPNSSPVATKGGLTATPPSDSSTVSPGSATRSARPIAIRKISNASSSNASFGSPGAASSWQLLEKG